MLALVETTGAPNAEQMALASGCAVTRTARVSRPPVTQSGTLSAAGSTQVTGPGQEFPTSCMREGGKAARRGRICSKALAINMNPERIGRRLSRRRRRTAEARKGSQPRPRTPSLG